MNSDTLYKRIKAMQTELGTDATFRILAEAGALDEYAAESGLTPKGYGGDDGLYAELSDNELHGLLDELSAEKERRGGGSDSSSATVTLLDSSGIATAVKEAMQPYLVQIEALVSNRTKEQVERDRQAASLRDEIQILQDKLKELESGQEQLQNDVNPVGSRSNGHRPSQHNQPLATEKVTSAVKQAAQQPDGIDGVIGDLFGEGGG